jgi:hypothetical protein
MAYSSIYKIYRYLISDLFFLICRNLKYQFHETLYSIGDRFAEQEFDLSCSFRCKDWGRVVEKNSCLAPALGVANS